MKTLITILIVSLISCTGMTPAFSGEGVHFSLVEAQQCVRDGKAARLLQSPPTVTTDAPGGYLVDGLTVRSDPDNPIRLTVGWQDLTFPMTIDPAFEVKAKEPDHFFGKGFWYTLGVITPIILGGLAYGAAK